MDVHRVPFAGQVAIGQGDALIVVDLQNDFMPGGALSVPEGDVIIPGVNTLMERFFRRGCAIALTQDWHPPGHRSFASAHAGRLPFDPYEEPGIGPVLWPDHCVQGTPGADFHEGVQTQFAQAVVRKGIHMAVDSYSGFLENDRATATGLDGYLRGRMVKRIFLCGLALDYCVCYTALDGVDLGYAVYVLQEYTRPVGSPPGSVTNALGSLNERGVRFLRSGDLID